VVTSALHDEPEGRKARLLAGIQGYGLDDAEYYLAV
jgi:hypothetical protein